MTEHRTNLKINKFEQSFIGNKIKFRRQQLLFYIDELADLVNIKTEDLISYEDGAKDIPASLLKKLADVLGTSVEYFVRQIRDIPF